MADFQKMRDDFLALVEKNSEVKDVLKKINNSSATFEEANILSQELGSMLKKTFGDGLSAAEIDEASMKFAKKMIQSASDVTKDACDVIQGDLNKLGGVGLQSVIPDDDTERLNGLIDSCSEGIETDEQVLSMLGDKSIDFLRAVVDDWIKENADFQASAGMEPILIRKWDGITGSHDTRHTDYCASLAGTYNYGEEPSNFYMRHERCGCSVTYYPNRKAKGRVTALSKGQTDEFMQLWNTKGSSYSRNETRRSAKRSSLKDAVKVGEHYFDGTDWDALFAEGLRHYQKHGSLG